ncbi:MAG: DNA-processing protein DprA [Patescibacteria group bacterium]
MEISEICLSDDRYPALLREIADPPEKLFIWGDFEALSHNTLAIVGSRKPSDYGVRVATHLAQELSRSLIIVSGIAYGIDTIALTTAAPHGHAVAVVGSGLDQASFYPASNWNLANKIVEAGGAIISEYPPGTPPLKHHFPARNRIIAGLSLGVLVVEAAEQSGALITADFALQFNREVLAVAGNIFSPQAVGTNKLIQEGACMVTGPADIWDSLGLTPPALASQLTIEFLPEEQTIINILINQTEGLSVTEITHRSKLDIAKVSSTLTMMEIKGAIKNIGAGKFTCLIS